MDIVKISLENEMDLMLAYKRSMKLAELCGLSVINQTSFATAVSEIARCVIKDKKDKPILLLKIEIFRNSKKNLIASIRTKADFEKDHPDALKYARRLSDGITINKNSENTEIAFLHAIGFSGLINDAKLESFVSYFKTEPALSPYDEIRKKNIMLLEVTEKFRNSENKYRELTKTLPLMVFTTNSFGNLNYGNKWLMDFFKILEVVPDKLSWTNFVHATDMKRVKEEWDNSFINQSPFKTEARLNSKDKGDFLWHLVSLTPVKNEDFKLISWTGFFVDIHSQKLVEETLKDNEELKEAQKQLLKYQKNLEEKVSELNRSNHDLEQFAYIASHDLQEPLRKIRTFAALITKHINNPVLIENHINKIESSSARMVSLIKDVLNYSRLIKTDNNFTDTDLNAVFANILSDMELIIEEKSAVIKIADLPHINAVSRQIFQLFYNLISNALKFNEDKPRINISCTQLTKIEIARLPELHINSKYIEIVVKDNGIGFDEKYAQQIFIIFKRLHERESYAGTGIGLALCKKIVDNHHGIISAKGKNKEGAEFRVILPIE